MSRREQSYQRVIHHQVITSTSPEKLIGGEILPTYSGKVVQPKQYSARHYYSEHSNQSRSPVIRVSNNRNGMNDRTPVNNRQGQIISNQDLQKTQNNKRGSRPSQETSEQFSNRNSHSRAADIIKRYSSGANSKVQEKPSNQNLKHSVQTIDALNKKYQLGLEGEQNTATKTKPQPYGYDSGMTVPNNYNVNPAFNRTQGGEEGEVHLDQFDGNSNDIESVEYDETAHKPIYQKETKIIQRRETVDPAVINRNTDFSDMGKSNSNQNLNGNITDNDLTNFDKNVRQDPVIGERQRTTKRKQNRDKNPLSVISSEDRMNSSRGQGDRAGASNNQG